MTSEWAADQSRRRDLLTAAALRQLQLLGKDPARTWFRTIRHGGGGANGKRKGADLHGFDAAALAADNAAGEALYAVIGEAAAATGVHKRTGLPTGAVCDDDIKTLPAVFVEWDEGSLADQQVAWQRLGLPLPTLMLTTGGKSVHCYWRLRTPVSAADWKVATARLIEHCQSDSSCDNPSRVMRVAGSAYINKTTGKPTGTVAEIVHEAPEAQYDLRQVMDCIPAPKPMQTRQRAATAPQRPAATTAGGDLPPRSMEQIKAALDCIPRRVPGNNTYPENRNVLWGLIDAVVTAGGTIDDAIALMEAHSPSGVSGWNVEQVARSGDGRVTAASFWDAARDHGYDLRRHDLKRPTPTPPMNGEPFIPDDAPEKAAPASAAPDQPPLTIEAITTQLREAIKTGTTRTELAALVADLASTSGQTVVAIQRIADAIEAEVQQAAAVAAETQQLAAAQDHREIGQHLSADYLLPQAIATAIERRTRYLPCAGPSAVLPFLTAIAGLTKVGTQVEGIRVAGYRVPTNLFTCVVAVSGAKKSPCSRQLINEPLEEIVLEIAAANRRAQEVHQEQCRGVKAADRPAPPRPKRVTVSEYTGEALAQQLQTQEAAGLGLLINRDELSGMFGSLNKYRAGRGDDEQQLLELFDGGGMTSLRICGDRQFSRSQVSIYGTTQPGILKKLVAEGDDSGLWARFLFVPLPATVTPLPTTTSPEEVEAVEQAGELLATICRRVWQMAPRTYSLTADATQRFSNYEAGRAALAVRSSGAASAVFGKSAGKVLRVAGLLHLLQIAADEIKAGEAISDETISKAAALVDHLDQWALSLHADAAAGDGLNLMQKVHGIALAANRPIRWKEVREKISARQRRAIDSSGFAEAAAALASAGYGEVTKGERGAISYQATKPLP